MGLSLPLLCGRSCGLAGSQFGSPDCPASAKSSSDRCNSDAFRFRAAGFGGEISSSSEESDDDVVYTDGAFVTLLFPFPFPFFFLRLAASSSNLIHSLAQPTSFFYVWK